MTLTSALALDRRFLAPAPGLVAQVFPGADSETPAGPATADSSFDPGRLASTIGLDPRNAFRVEWTGVLAVERAGVHWFKLAADDDASLWIDGEPVVDQSSPMGADRTRGGRAQLTCALHQIRLRYVQRGGDHRLRLSWATPDYREDWRGLPVFQPATAASTIGAITLRREAPITLASAWGVWLGAAFLFGLLRIAAAGWDLFAPLRTSGLALRLVLFVGFIAFSASIQWGLPTSRPWGLDEVMPAEVETALAMRLSGGWHGIYPPFHYVLLSLVQAPSFVFERIGWLLADDAAVTAARHLTGRVLTLILGWSTLVLVYLCACQAGSPRVGGWAAASAITLPLVYYAKTTNLDVPYLFWVVASMLFFLRALRTLDWRDCCGVAITAGCAVCTKDQAYGFYPGMAVALAFAALRGDPSRAVVVSRLKALAIGLFVFVAVFVMGQNLVFNFEGFRAHIESITTTAGPETYRMFPATASGVAALAASTLQLIPWCSGWPLTVASMAGLLLLAASRSPSRPANGETGVSLLWLAVPAVSYLLTFVAVVGYVYDRFLLGVLVVHALWAGVAFERLARWRPLGRPAGLVIALLSVSVTLFGYAPSVNGAMARDSRLAAETWLRTHAGDDPVVVGIGGQEYLPNLRPWRFRLTSARASDVFDWNADYIVVNEPLARRLGASLAEPAALPRLESGETGYVRVFRQRTALPWVSLLRHTQWWQRENEEPFSNLKKIGPTISIWTKRRGL